LQLYEYTGHHKYLQAASRANQYVRRTMQLDGTAGLRGGVKGSFPVDGEYCALELPNWAAKFTIDANLAELDCLTRMRELDAAQAEEASEQQRRRIGALRSA
jgi:hypothetical protein